MEDEIHFLTECHLYDNLRYKVFQSLSSDDLDFNNLPLLAKGCKIMCFNNQFVIGKMVFLMFQRRKLYYER